MDKLLWLDDLRDPFTGWFQIYSPFRVLAEDVVWVKNYQEFKDWIIANGLPEGICFDHDLGEEHYNLEWDTDCLSWEEYYLRQDREQTGYDCAKWLVNYCIENNLKLPSWRVHSANSVGKKNIEALLNNFNNNEEK